MKIENIIKCLVIIGLFNSISALKANKREYMNDLGDLYTRECRYMTTLNLKMMNDCLKYLSELSITEKELNTLCESFKDYYAKDNDTGTDTEAETDNEDEDEDENENENENAGEDENNIIDTSIETNNNDNIENVSILQLSDLTEEEKEKAEKINQLINNVITDENKLNKLETLKNHHKRDNHKKKRNICRVFVRKWNYECRDISRIAPTINAALENYYFRRHSFCLKNSENRYCTIVMNEIKNNVFNGTENVINSLNEVQRNNTCECYKLKMDYLKEEYYSSKDPDVVKKKKSYSKSRGNRKEDILTSNQNKKRNLFQHYIINNNNNYNDDNDNNDNDNDNEKSFTKNNKLLILLENFVVSYFPRMGINRRPRYTFPSFKELITNVNSPKNEKKEEEEQKYNQDFLEKINKILNHNRFEKRMVNEMNIKELKKQIMRYQKEMDKLMDTSICNVTFTYTPTKNQVSGYSSKKQVINTLAFVFLFEILIQFIL